MSYQRLFLQSPTRRIIGQQVQFLKLEQFSTTTKYLASANNNANNSSSSNASSSTSTTTTTSPSSSSSKPSKKKVTPIAEYKPERVPTTSRKMTETLSNIPGAIKAIKMIGKLFRYDDLRVGAIKSTGYHYEGCADRWRTDPFWIKECGLPDTFQTWFQVTMLHIYVLTVRYRALPEGQGQAFTQEIINHVFLDAERRMKDVYDVTTSTLIKRYMNDILYQYHGAVLSYDEGLISGDAVLATALWRNLFGTGWGFVAGVESSGRKRREGMSTSRTIDRSTQEAVIFEETRFVPQLERIVLWMRHEIHRLEQLSDEQIKSTNLQSPNAASSPVNFSKP